MRGGADISVRRAPRVFPKKPGRPEWPEWSGRRARLEACLAALERRAALGRGRAFDASHALIFAAHALAPSGGPFCAAWIQGMDAKRYVWRSLARLAAILGLAGSRDNPVVAPVYDRHALYQALAQGAARGRFPDPSLVWTLQEMFLRVCRMAHSAGAGPVPRIAALFSLDADTRAVLDHAFLRIVAQNNMEQGFIVMCDAQNACVPRCASAARTRRASGPGILAQIRALSRLEPARGDCAIRLLVPERPVTAPAVMAALIAHALAVARACFAVVPGGEEALRKRYVARNDAATGA